MAACSVGKWPLALTARLKQQCLWARTYRNVDDLRQAVADFVELYNTQWLIERLGHRTPRQTYQEWLATQEQAA